MKKKIAAAAAALLVLLLGIRIWRSAGIYSMTESKI